MKGEQEEATGSSPPNTDSLVPDWLYPNRIENQTLRGHGAQLHPFLFTSTMAQETTSSGVQILMARASSIDYSEDGKSVEGVSYQFRGSEEVHKMPADHVVIAAGPWTSTILPKVPVTGERNCAIHLSVPSELLSPDLVFFNKNVPDSWFPRFKFYPRPDDTIHISAGTDHLCPLPASTDLVEADKEICKRLRDTSDFISPRLQGRKLLVEQACYRPALTIIGLLKQQVAQM